jgi:translocation and assembly module TamB
MAIKGLEPDADPDPPAPVRRGSRQLANPGGRPARRRRWIRWLLAALAMPLVGVLLAAFGVWFVARDLDRPWIKSRLIAFSQDQLGLGIDYEGLALSLSDGLRARSFRILSPPRLAAGAPELVRIEDLELRARLWAFLFGERTVERFTIGRISVAVVSDAAGNTSLSELFPPDPEPKDDSPLRPSQLLAELPTLSIETIEVGEIGARLVELRPDGSSRSTALSSLSLRGTLHAGNGLSGTELRVLGAPLGVDVSDGGATQHAELPVDLTLSAADAESVAIGLRVSLGRQDFAPSWPWQGELIALDANLRADAAASKTSVSIAPLRALAGELSLEGRADVFDSKEATVQRVVASGKIHVAVPALPVAIPGVSIDALVLDLTTQDLAWDGARVAGAVELGGSLRGAALLTDEARASVAGLSLSGQGSFRPEGGRFQANLKASSLAASAAEANLDLDGISLDLDGTTQELDSAQQIDANAVLGIRATKLRAAAQSIEARAVRWHTRANGTAQELAAQRVGKLSSELSLDSLEARDAERRTTLEHVAASASVDHLAVDAAAAFGVQGDATLAVTLPLVRVLEGGGQKARSPALRIQGVELTAALPLDAAHAKAALTLGSLTAAGSSLGELELDLTLDRPLAWAPEGSEDGSEPARADVRGKLARFDVGGGTHGALEDILLVAHKAGRDHYRLELDVKGSSLALAGSPLPGVLALGIRGDAQPAAGALQASTTLRGDRGARLDLELDGKFERQSGRLQYELDLGAEKLDAFASLASDVDPRAGRVRLEGARLAGSARGDLAGVLRSGEGLVPVLTENPLGTARGSQNATLTLEGLDYRGPDRALGIPKLELELTSTHRAANGGQANARLSMRELRLEGGGTSLHLEAVEQKLAATFERAPDQGVVDVRTSLELGRAAQSWLPGYPVRDLKLSSNVQIDRLRSIFLRELLLDNPASGSKLRAAGTLELLAHSGQTSSSKTIAGREALSFEGRFQQEMEPLEGMDIASHARGSIELPFRLESGGLLGYRLIAALEAKAVSFTKKDGSMAIEGLQGTIPVLEEFALLDSGPVISAGPRTSPLSDTRFFDVHPFLTGNDFVTARSLRLGGMAPLGPIAANVRLERSDFIIDQLQTGYQGGQIVGQVRVAFRDGDPIARLRLNATGVRSGKSRDVFDANLALSFVPRAMTLDGKVQIVRASREHLEDILDMLDPFHESANANRVRQGLALGYPKFVRFQLHDGAVDTKVELGGLAQLVRIDEIRAVPLGPILQKYVAPSLAEYLQPDQQAPSGEPPPAEGPAPRGALETDASEERASRVER